MGHAIASRNRLPVCLFMTNLLRCSSMLVSVACTWSPQLLPELTASWSCAISAGKHSRQLQGSAP